MLKLSVCLVLRNLKQTYINDGLTIEKKMKFSYQKLATHKEIDTKNSYVYEGSFIPEYSSTNTFFE